MDSPQISKRLGAVILLLLFTIFIAWIVGYFYAFGWFWALPLAYLTVWLNMFVHEMGHLIVALIMRIRVVGVFLGCSPLTKPLGPRLKFRIGSVAVRIGVAWNGGILPDSKRQERAHVYPKMIAIVATGPLMNVVLFAAGLYSMSLPGTLIAAVAAVYMFESLVPWGTTDMTHILANWQLWREERKLETAYKRGRQAMNERKRRRE